jgi:hypothetical protein
MIVIVVDFGAIGGKRIYQEESWRSTGLLLVSC